MPTDMLLAIGIAILTGMALLMFWLWKQGLRHPEDEQPLPKDAECLSCGRTMWNVEIHDVPEDIQETDDGGSAVLQEFCADCCPGGCQRDHEGDAA